MGPRHQHKHERDVAAELELERKQDEVKPKWPGKKTLTGDKPVDARVPDLKRIRAAISALRGGGAPLPGAMTKEYSKLLGLDLSDVRLHRGGAASEAAKSLDATAFTHGTDIAVADHLDLDSAFGRHVIAHELVHVAQNKRSGGEMTAARAEVGPSGSAVEQEAERGALALTRGMSFSVGAHGRLPSISRFGNDENPPTGAATPVPVPGANPPPVDAPVRAQVPTPTSQPTQARPAQTPRQAAPTPAATPAPQARPTNQPAPANAPQAGVPGVNAPSGSGGAPNPTTPANREPRPAAAPRATTPAMTLDERVKQELENRADPTLKAGYAKAVAGVDALRVQALQFSFQPNGVWNTLVETFTAKNAFQDHFGQIYSTTAYRGGTSWADTAQVWIEGLRGVVHIIGDVASVISAWAGLAALVTGALALILSETVIGGIALGAIAAIAAEVAMVAGAIKLLTDIIDTILGVIQMIILIVRARNSKDPAARARFAQLLHKEANDFGANVVSIGVQVAVMAVSAGVGAGLSRGANSFVSSFRSEFTRMITPALKPWTLGSNVRNIANMMKPAAAGSGVRTMTGTNLRGQTVPRTVLNAETEAGIVAIQRNVRGPRGRMTTAKEIVAFTPANQMKGARLVLMRRALISSLIVNTGGFKIGLGASQLQADIKQPRDFQRGGTSSSSPSANGGRLDVPQAAGADLSKVQMWPTQLEAFETAKGPLQGATDRTQRQYEMAEAQAGPELAAQVRTAFAGATNSAGQMRFGAMQVQTDAQEGQANTQRGLSQTQQAGQQQGQLAVQQNRANTSVQRISNEGAKLQSPPPKEGVLGWLYNQTIGRIGAWIGSAQKWVMNLVGKWAMSAAGFSKEEMDIAGIENDMREDDKKDQTSSQEAQDAALKADQIQQTVFQLQENKTRDEQYAIQGMADAQRFMQALEDADRQLAAAIANGQTYIGQVTPLIAHELQTEETQASIDAAYIAPAGAAVQAFTDSIDNANAGDRTQQQGAAALNQLKAAFPELDITQGTTAITGATQSYATAFGVLAGSARTQAAAIHTALQAFIGTQDYDGVAANAAALETLAADFDRQATELQNQLVAAVQGVVDQHVDHIIDAIAQAQQIPDDEAVNDNEPAVQRKALSNATAPQQMQQAEAKVPTDINNPAQPAPPVPANAADNANAPAPVESPATGAQVPGAAPNGATASNPKDGLIGGASNTTDTPATAAKAKPPGATPKQQANPAGADKAPIEAENEAEQSVTAATAGTGAGSDGSDGASAPGAAPDKPARREVTPVPEQAATTRTAPRVPSAPEAKAEQPPRKLVDDQAATEVAAESEVDQEPEPIEARDEEVEEEDEADVAVQRRALSSSTGVDQTGSLEASQVAVQRRSLGSSTTVVQRAWSGSLDASAEATQVGAQRRSSDGKSPVAVQRRALGAGTASPAAIALQATAGSGSSLPHLETIQRSFGSHDVSGIRAHTGGAAEAGAAALNAKAFAVGDAVAFGASPDLHTAAHEAAHVVQQRAGLGPKGGIDGGSSDALEQHADEVADAVVAGRSAQPILDRVVGTNGSTTTGTLGAKGETAGSAFTKPASANPTTVTKKASSIGSTSSTTVTSKKSKQAAAAEAKAPEQAAPVAEKPGKEAPPVAPVKPVEPKEPGFATLQGTPPELLGKKLTEIHTAQTADTAKQRAAQQANPPKQMSTGDAAKQEPPKDTKAPKSETPDAASAPNADATKTPIVAAAPGAEAAKQAKQGAAAQQQTHGQQLVAQIAQSITSWFGTWSSLFGGGGGGKAKMSKEESADIAGSVDKLATTVVAPPADPNHPQVAEKAKADASAQRDRADFDRKAAAAHEQGVADASMPMGEDHITTSVMTEELSAKIADGGAVPPPAVLPTLANSGATEEVGIVAREEQGAEIDAALTKANADVIAERTKHTAAETAARAEADASLKQIKAQSEAEQTAAREAAKTEVAASRAQWKAEVENKGADARARADKKVAEGMATIDAEEAKANAEAKRHIAEGQQKAAEEQQKGEAEAEAAKERGKNESKGFFGWLASKAKAAFEGIKRAVSAALDAARAAVKAVIDGAKKLAMAAIDLARKAINVAIKLIGDALLAISDVLLAAFPEIKAKFQAAIKTAVDKATALVNKLADGLKKAVQAALDLLGTVLDAALKAYETAINFVIDAAAAVVEGAIKAAQAVVDKLAQWATIIKDVASGPVAWIGKLGAAAVDGVKNHLWTALKTAVVEWFSSKVFEILGVGGMLLQMLLDGGMSKQDIIDMALEALMTAIPMALAAVLIEQVIAMIVPAAGAVMAIIRGLQAAWGTISRILAAFEAFITFLQMVQSGQAGPQFAQLIALSAVVVLDFVSNYLLAKIMGPAKKVGDKLKGLAKKFGGKKGPKAKAPGTRAGVKAKAPKRDTATKPTMTKPKKSDATKPKPKAKDSKKGKDDNKQDRDTADKRAAKRAADAGAKRVWGLAKKSDKVMSSGELQSLMLKAKSTGKAKVKATPTETGESWSVRAEATVGKSTATSTAGRGWIAKSTGGAPFYAGKNLSTFNKQLVASAFAELRKHDTSKQESSLRKVYDDLVKRAAAEEKAQQSKLDQKLKGLTFDIKLEPFAGVETDNKATTTITVSPNTIKKEEELGLEVDPFPFRVEAPKGDLRFKNVAKRQYFNAPRPSPMLGTDKIHGYVINMMSTPDDVKANLANRYAVDAWAGKGDAERELGKHRTAVVVGVNRFRSIDATQDQDAQRRIGDGVNLIAWPKGTVMAAIGFAWEPHWVDKAGATVGYKKVKEHFGKLKGEDINTAKAREKEVLSSDSANNKLPWGQIRNKIFDGPSERAVSALNTKFDPVYVLNQDADGAVNVTDGMGLLAAYDRTLKETDKDPLLVIGGYHYAGFNWGENTGSRVQQLTTWSNMIDRAVRTAIGKEWPWMLYPTEPNTLIKARDKENKDGVLDRRPETSQLFGTGAHEGRTAREKILRGGAKQGDAPKHGGRVVHDERLAVPTDPRVENPKRGLAVSEDSVRQANAGETMAEAKRLPVTDPAVSKHPGEAITMQRQSMMNPFNIEGEDRKSMKSGGSVERRQEVLEPIADANRIQTDPTLNDEQRRQQIDKLKRDIGEDLKAMLERARDKKEREWLQRLGAIRKLVIDTLTSAALEGVYADLRALLKTILTEGKALEAEYQNLRSQATQQP